MKGFIFKLVTIITFLPIIFLSTLTFASNINSNAKLGCMACHQMDSMQTNHVAKKRIHHSTSPKVGTNRID